MVQRLLVCILALFLVVGPVASACAMVAPQGHEHHQKSEAKPASCMAHACCAPSVQLVEAPAMPVAFRPLPVEVADSVLPSRGPPAFWRPPREGV